MADQDPAQSARFFSDLPAFRNFSGVADPHNYRALPDHWQVVVADIEHSTAHCLSGREKAVNMVGAAAVMAVLNAAERHSIPFVFGGDGASLAIPQELRPKVERQLRALRALARDLYGFRLRVAIIPISEVRAAGRDVRVARFELSPGNHVATFSGGGMELAESWTKGDGRRLLDAAGATEPVNLKGLSCRFEPLIPERGVSLSTLVRARGADTATIYRAVLADFADIMAPVPEAGPVHAGNLHLRWPSAGLAVEAALAGGGGRGLTARVAVYANALLQWVLDRFDLRAGAFDAPAYREELRRNADHRRFDDTLRILFDCDRAQASAIEEMLTRRQSAGELYFGVHRADRAYMTCLVFDLGRGEHLHFVDGAGGGFTAAARDLKARLTNTC